MMDDYPLLESIRLCDGRFDLIEYHGKRIKDAWQKLFGYSNDLFSLSDYLNTFDFPVEGLFKCRLLYGKTMLAPEFIPYQKRNIESLKLVHSNTIDYHFKFADRKQLNDLFAQKEDCDDILIIRNGLITDTSFCNIAFRKGDDWFTPENPLLAGVRRASLLDAGIIRSKMIDFNMMGEFESFKLFNAMIPWEEAEETVLRLKFKV
ncbi:MAG: 4-amino-4-deoxychorismate lyase [Bacteroidales bacterium]|nr:4-amino-4-deoxychorismate lyase [Bacteroidales bacterium]